METYNKSDRRSDRRSDRQNYEELIELIKLAERTSEKAIEYQNSLLLYNFILIFSTTVFISTVSLWLLYFIPHQSDDGLTNYLNVNSFLFFLFICFLITITFYLLILKMKKERDLMAEKKVLSKLIIMTHELKEYVFSSKEVSVIERAMVEMRLSRIRFSIREDSLHRNYNNKGNE